MKKKLEIETQMAKLETEEKIVTDFRSSVVKESYEKLFEITQKTTLPPRTLSDAKTTVQKERGTPRRVSQSL